ncbi:MAG: hypothetical protein IT307_18835, partial [Chloroflexi bacterium]|nr:hypothetical protein [Chloroflexota bacterium]
WPRLDRIQVPVYFGCHWAFWNLHLRGAFSGWQGTGNIAKRMFIGPETSPRRPVAEYHGEALRWYDHWLKGMDTGVLDTPPIQLWIQGDDIWRTESEWPLARTEWRQLYLGGPSGGVEGTLDWTVQNGGEQTYEMVPDSQDWVWGKPRLVYRSAPVDEPLEVTGPLQLDLWLASSAADTDLFVTLFDEGPGGSTRVLTKGWLRASHRAIDPARGRPNQPWHPHTSTEPLTPGQPTLLPIEIISTCNVFHPGHRVRLEIGSCDSLAENPFWYHRGLVSPVRNTVLGGGSQASVLHVPVIPR